MLRESLDNLFREQVRWRCRLEGLTWVGEPAAAKVVYWADQRVWDFSRSFGAHAFVVGVHDHREPTGVRLKGIVVTTARSSQAGPGLTSSDQVADAVSLCRLRPACGWKRRGWLVRVKRLTMGCNRVKPVAVVDTEQCGSFDSGESAQRLRAHGDVGG